MNRCQCRVWKPSQVITLHEKKLCTHGCDALHTH